MPQSQAKLIIGGEFADKSIPLIKQAQKTIDIIVYDWRWYPNQIGSAVQRFNNEIINSRKRGRRIRVITNSFNLTNILKPLGFEVRNSASKKTLHTKLMIIDNKTAILGSHNYTMNAFTVNYEVSIIVWEAKIIERLKSYFENLWGL